MSPHDPTAATDALEWSGSELAAVDPAGPAGPGAYTLRFSAAKVWRAGQAGFWPDWHLTLWGATLLARCTPAYGRVTDGHWMPEGGPAAARWAWGEAAPGPGELVLHLAHGGQWHVRAASWTVQVSRERPWREDWSC